MPSLEITHPFGKKYDPAIYTRMNCDLSLSKGRCNGALRAPCGPRHGPHHPPGHDLASELLGLMQLPPGSPASIT